MLIHLLSLHTHTQAAEGVKEGEARAQRAQAEAAKEEEHNRISNSFTENMTARKRMVSLSVQNYFYSLSLNCCYCLGL